LLATSFILVFPSVNAAQTTRIYELVHPIHAVAGSLDPIHVSATIFYNGSAPGNSLLVGILDADKTPQTVVAGIITRSSRPCANPPLAAVCRMNISAGSGAEQLEFQIGGILGDKHGIGRWNLNITAVLLDSANKLIPNSASSILFTIQLTPAIFTVIVPAAVTVYVDGVKQPPGPAQVPVVLGEHNVTLPTIAQVDATTRVRFDHWADGSTEANRTLFIANDTSFEIAYVTQHLLTITGPQLTSTGAGWYDENTTAAFSVAPVEPMSGHLGVLGGKLKFQGWYENGKLLTDQTSGTIIMNQPHTITAVWQTDYSLPALILLGILIVVALVYLFVRRGNITKRKTRRSTRR
jgi:hypothetical protein